MTAKRFELLRELVPAATRVAVLIDSANPDYTETTVKEVGAAARAVGLQIQVVKAVSSEALISSGPFQGQVQSDYQIESVSGAATAL